MKARLGALIPIVATVGLLGPATAQAQAAPLVVEIRTGASIPVGSFAGGSGIGEGVGSGFSMGLDFAMSGSGRRTWYAGFSQHRFACVDAGCPHGGHDVATTLDAGVRVSLLTRGSVIPWIRLGGITTRVESPGVPGSPQGVSRRGYGGEAGLGVYAGAWSALAFNPGVRFQAVNTELPGGPVLRMRFVVVDLGFSLAF